LLLLISVVILPLEGIGAYLGLIILVIMFSFLFLSFFNYRLQNWIYLLAIYSITYIIFGINNNAWLPDVRITLTNILLLLLLVRYFSKIPCSRIIKTIFHLNIFAFLIFILTYFKIIPNLFFDNIISAYHDYKTSANPIFLFYILPFVYALLQIRIDKIIFANLIMGGIVGLLSGSLQNLTLILVIHAILIFDLRHISIKSFLLLIGVAITFYLSLRYVDSRFVSKMSNIITPLESNTIRTRILDLLYIWPKATESIEKIIFGSGIGIRSTTYRVHVLSPSLSDYRTFLEIDNGFFYIFHRYGLIGFSLFLIVHKNLLNKIKGFNAKVIFIIVILIVNALTIHYWTQYISAILIALIIRFNHEHTQQNNPLQRTRY